MGQHRGPPWALLAVSLLALVLAHSRCLAAELEGLEDEPAPQGAGQQQWETLNLQEPGQASSGQGQASSSASSTSTSGSDSAALAERRKLEFLASGAGTIGRIEIAALSFLAVFIINLVIGRRTNDRIAAAWAKAFCEQGGIFDKNFSLLGQGEKGETLVKDAANVYKFYATGRRHVQGLLATLNLKARQDLLDIVWRFINPTEDTVTFEAFMNDTSMPPIVLAVATPKAMRKLKDGEQDISQLTKKINAPKDVLPNWPDKRLHIMAEHSTVFTDLFAEPRVQQTLNPEGPHARAFKYFRSAHFTNAASTSVHKRLVRLTFALPPAEAMEDIAPLVALVPLLIDLVGSYKLSPDLLKKAEANRAKVEAANRDAEEEKRKRLEALAQRKAEKLAAEKARIARLPPDQRQREEEKLQKKQMEKQMRKRMVKIG